VNDIDVTLAQGSRTLATDGTRNAFPNVRFCPTAAARYTLTVKATSGQARTSTKCSSKATDADVDPVVSRRSLHLREARRPRATAPSGRCSARRSRGMRPPLRGSVRLQTRHWRLGSGVGIGARVQNELVLDQASVDAARLHQLVVRADLGDAAVVQHTMRSASRTVERRWAITSVVRPFIRRTSASCTSDSLSASRLLVASSRTSTRGSRSTARAIAMRCR